jgi:hypothetical protein
MSSSKRTKNKSAEPSPVEHDSDGAGSAEAFAEFLPIVAKIPTKEVRRLRGAPALALHNVGVGLAAVLEREAELLKLPPPFNLAELKSLRRLALALVYAAAQVDRSSPGLVAKLHRRAAESRDLLLTSALALMKAGLFPAAKVKKIVAGSGMRDAAQDCIDLAQLFRDHAAAVKGKTAIGKPQIDEAAAAGEQLLAVLKPARAKSRLSDGVKRAVDTRDRLWTLLSSRHEAQLRRAGMWLWVDDVDDHVPPLLSSARRTKRAAAESGSPGDSQPG